MRRFLATGLVLIAFTAAYGEEKTKGPAADGLARLKKLAGTWVATDASGKPTDNVVSVFKVTSAGSTVTETLFPGQPQEMLSIYHLDGKNLVMTHYCALGNQPRMKADPHSPTNELVFKFDGGTNFDPAKDMHMHEGTLKFIDDDHIEFTGVAWVGGKPSDQSCGLMKLTRKK
jgi:hypothetical protein